MYNNSYYGNYRTETFQEVWQSAAEFIEDYKKSEINSSAELLGQDTFSDAQLTMIYYLLYSRYANSSHASSDIHQFKYGVFSTIFMYAPSWLKRLEIQKKLRDLNEDELREGAVQWSDLAENPGTVIPAGDLIDGLKSQNVGRSKKSKLQAYAALAELLKTDVSNDFLSKFQRLFIRVVMPDYPLWYENEIIT